MGTHNTRKQKQPEDNQQPIGGRKRARIQGEDSDAPSDSTLDGFDVIPELSGTVPKDHDEGVVGTSTITANGHLNTTPAIVGNASSGTVNDKAADTESTNGETITTPIVEDEQLNLSADEREYITDEDCARLRPIMEFVDIEANRYAIGRFPLQASWGPIGNGRGLDRYLCVNGRPVTVWMVGIVTTHWFTPTEGSRVNVGIKLLTGKDQASAKRIQYGLCRPTGDPAKAGHTTYSSRFLNKDSVTFIEVYDGSEMLESWNTMTRLSHSRLEKTDVALVECYVKRFKSRDGPNRYAWTTWAVSFELLRIALLKRGPGPVDLVPEESVVAL